MGERRGQDQEKVLEPGFELGMPVAQRYDMSSHCPQGYRRRLTGINIENISLYNTWYCIEGKIH